MLLLCNVIISTPCSNLINSRLQKWNFNLFSSYYSLTINFQSIILAMMSILHFAQFQIKQTPFKEKRKMVYAKPTIICSLKAVMQQLECYNKQSNNINFIWLLHYHLKCNEAVCKNARDRGLLFLYHSIKIMLVEIFYMLQFNEILMNITIKLFLVIQ